MKSRFLIIIGIMIVVAISISLTYDQEIKLILKILTDEKSIDQYPEYTLGIMGVASVVIAMGYLFKQKD